MSCTRNGPLDMTEIKDNALGAQKDKKLDLYTQPMEYETTGYLLTLCYNRLTRQATDPGSHVNRLDKDKALDATMVVKGIIEDWTLNKVREEDANNYQRAVWRQGKEQRGEIKHLLQDYKRFTRR